MAEIVLDGISKRFPDGTEAVGRIDLAIGDGELFILVGPSGCGKSTLLNMIVGLEQPNTGEVRVDGRPVTHLDPKDRNMAMVFQSYAIYPHMTVRENMAFPLKLAKVRKSEIADRVQRAAEVLALTELLDRKPAALSGGQRQRVAMGRAIVRQPAAFLLDEPLSNLDAKLRVQMRTELARLQKRLGTTTVYVTHDQTEAMTLGDRVAVLRKGRLQQVGTPRALYEQPANLFVAGFIGSPAMNFLPALAEDGRLILPMVELPLPTLLRRRLPEDRLVCIAGVRPEHFHAVDLADPDERSTPAFTATVEVVEWMGADLYVHFEVSTDQGDRLRTLPEDLDLATHSNGKLRLVARVNGASRAAQGEPMGLRINPDKIALFDAQTGQRISGQD
ncbi:MAG: sn-glycerol-3-phosphate ABC transporter ATP-binding protein UgpC [Chromatiaceae bacterium]